VVKILLERGANINCKDEVSYNTLLYIYTILYYIYYILVYYIMYSYIILYDIILHM